MNCAYHLGNTAVVNCQGCGKFLCPACDHRIKGFPYCQDCIVMGVELLQRQAYSPAVPLVKKQTSPFLATFLSLICPGLGAAYNGQTAKALTFFAVFAGLFQLAVTTHGAPIFVFGFIGMWIYSAIDAFRMAQMIRSGITPNDAEDLLMKRLSGNPVLWGVILTVLGITFILQMFGGLRLPLREMLPVMFIGFGIYLLWNFWRKRSERKDWNDYSSHSSPGVSGELYSDLDEVTAFRSGDYSSQQRTGSWK
jgi:hypothetical protein